MDPTWPLKRTNTPLSRAVAADRLTHRALVPPGDLRPLVRARDGHIGSGTGPNRWPDDAVLTTTRRLLRHVAAVSGYPRCLYVAATVRVARQLPDLTPEQVIALQDELLANADSLLTSALTLLDQGKVALARSLAILGLEESGKAVVIHRRRVAIIHRPDGEPFVDELLTDLWGSHRRKLQVAYDFLRWEPYWFGTEPANPDENERVLGTVRAWVRRHDKLKQRGFYVEVDKVGDVLVPDHLADEESLAAVIRHIHQIGWQLRLGEHIEGKQPDEQEAGMPPPDPHVVELLAQAHADLGGPDGWHEEFDELLRQGVPGAPLNNAGYRFNRPGEVREPFEKLGARGYEAETRELLRMAQEFGMLPADGEDAVE